jgi:hypothetical protein
MPQRKHLSPAWGQRVGGVSEKPAQEKRRGVIPERTGVATVEGTLIHRISTAFAGCRWSVGLGRSVSRLRRSLPAWALGLATRGCPLVAAGGERRRRAPSVRTRPGKRANNAPHVTRTRPSLGPETRVRQSALQLHEEWPKASSRRACREQSGIAVGQTCESGRNRHRGLIARA